VLGLPTNIEAKIRASYVPTEIDPALVAAVDEATADVEF
jgi:recombination protein RecA